MKLSPDTGTRRGAVKWVYLAGWWTARFWYALADALAEPETDEFTVLRNGTRWN